MIIKTGRNEVRVKARGLTWQPSNRASAEIDPRRNAAPGSGHQRGSAREKQQGLGSGQTAPNPTPRKNAPSPTDHARAENEASPRQQRTIDQLAKTVPPTN